MISGIEDGTITPRDLPVGYYKAVTDYLKSAVMKGFGEKPQGYTERDAVLLEELLTNVYTFGAAKSFQQTQAISSLLVDEDGNRRSSREFNSVARSLYDKWNDDWGKTEYTTAIGQADMAAKWSYIESTKDVIPNLKYSAVIDPNTSEICLPLNGIVAPIDDAIWDSITPLNHFNCRCTLIQVDDAITQGNEAKAKQVEQEMQPLFINNSGKTGSIFPKDHPYYEVAKEYRAFAKQNFGLPLPDIKIPIAEKMYSKTNITVEGKEISLKEQHKALNLAGIPHNYEGRVNIIQYQTGYEIKVYDNSFKMIRIIDTKNKEITNEYFLIKDESKYKGQGANIFNQQVQFASKEGYSTIFTSAARGDRYNGYYTWARLGYDTNSNYDLKKIGVLIEDFNTTNKTDVKTFRELLSTKTGQEFWKKEGFSFEGTFDLSENSKSMITLKNYIDGRGKK